MVGVASAIDADDLTKRLKLDPFKTNRAETSRRPSIWRFGHCGNFNTAIRENGMPTVKFYGGFTNATADHERIIKAGGEVINDVMAKWDDFAAAVRAADFSGGTLWRAVDRTVVSKTKDQILEIIERGREREAPAPDNEIDIRIELRPHPKGTVGTTTLGKNPIRPSFWFTDQCVRKNDAISMARHLMHEWMHVAGFFHSSSGPNQDDVAYEIGDVVRKLAKDLRASLIEKGETPAYEEEDSLIAHLLDQAEDSVDWEDDKGAVITTSTVTSDLND